MKKLNNIFLVAIAFICMTACESKPIPEDSLFYTEAQVKELVGDGTLYTLNEFVAAFMTEKGNYQSDTTHYRTRANNEGVNPNVWLFSIDTLPSTGPGIFIRGRVTTDDYGGNFYKSLVIQQMAYDETLGREVQQALRISLDAGSASGMYPMGQEILIRCNGLAIGRYANQVQLCVPSHNNNVWASSADQKVGWAPGRIPMARFKANCFLIGAPDQTKLHIDNYTIAEIVASYDIKKARNLDGCLVRIQNIHYTGQYEYNGTLTDCTTGNPESDTYANVFAPTTGNVGYPQSRVITDGTASTLTSMSEYAKEANYYLPGADSDGVSHCAEWSGTVTGILSYYMDNANYSADQWNWSISLRDLTDLELYHSSDTEHLLDWLTNFAYEYTN